MKQADQPAANICSGLVPLPGAPSDKSLMSKRPSELRDAPFRPPVVWAWRCIALCRRSWSWWTPGKRTVRWACAATIKCLFRGHVDDPATSRRIFPPRCACAMASLIEERG
jgi:hypothetical protein